LRMSGMYPLLARSHTGLAQLVGIFSDPIEEQQPTDRHHIHQQHTQAQVRASGCERIEGAGGRARSGPLHQCLMLVNRSCNGTRRVHTKATQGAHVCAYAVAFLQSCYVRAAEVRVPGFPSCHSPCGALHAAAYTLLIGAQEVSYTSIGTSRSIVPPHLGFHAREAGPCLYNVHPATAEDIVRVIKRVNN
jgi:hypothetical protein